VNRFVECAYRTRPVKTEWWCAGMVICLRGTDLHTAQLMPLPLTVFCFSKIQIGLPFWYLLTQAVPEKGPLNMCVSALYVLSAEVVRRGTLIFLFSSF